MGTTWNTNRDENRNSNTGRLAAPRKEVARIGKDASSAWTRADKIGAVVCLVLLGVLLVVSACSREQSKSVAGGVTTPAPAAASFKPAELPGTGTVAPSGLPTAPAQKKAHRKRAANVKYSDANSGLSFMYPRKAKLASGDNGQTESANLPMNFVGAGGAPVATISLPAKPYAGTDFEAAQFRVNVNRSVSAEQCPHFAFVDTSDADGEPIDAESVKVGSSDMKMTSEFSGNAARQLETRYYHAYENGACYEYVLGLSTAGFGQEGVHAVDRDEVFGKLEKILATVKVRPVEPVQTAQEMGEAKPAGPEAQKVDAQKLDVQKQDAKDASKQNVQRSEPEQQPAADAAVPDPGK
ncbi:MAG TPA: hypothetical protein VMI10_08200 [Terriglobales bacterium]|nr:hypothetical protein [Terriglobales bacterium]